MFPEALTRLLLPTLLLIACLVETAAAQAQREPSAYDGVQLAPTVLLSVSGPHYQGGFGADLSVSRWLDLELWGTRVSEPNADSSYPGHWAAGLAVNSRVAWHTSAFVYGLGLTYTSRFECPVGCSVLSFSLEEHRAADDLLAAQLRAGYEARFEHAFLRVLASFNLPFSSSYVEHVSSGDRYPYHETPTRFMHCAVAFTAGYVFHL